jgi:hypothetical protein
MRRLGTGRNIPLVTHDSPHCNEVPKYQTARSFRNQTKVGSTKEARRVEAAGFLRGYATPAGPWGLTRLGVILEVAS